MDGGERMTFLEKAMEIEADNLKDGIGIYESKVSDIVERYCPSEYGLEESNPKCDDNCQECWNREMLKTEINDEPSCDDVKAAYDQGMGDAWELARAIIGIKNKDNRTLLARELIAIYRTNDLLEVFKFTPQEALAKLKAYEEAQEIKVGDVIEFRMEKGVVIWKDDKVCNVVRGDGSIVIEIPLNEATKTGKHIDIQNILKQIGE
jgi:hypothetical protein